MCTLLKPLSVREELLRRNVRIFTHREFQRIFETNYEATKYFLETQTAGGFLVRLKKGLYMLKTDPSPEEEIANILYQPSYISFEYALAFYGILPESIYSITSASTKPTRRFLVQNIEYQYLSIRREAYTGYYLHDIPGKRILIAEPEKALLDYIYFESLGKKPHNDRIESQSLDKKKLDQYVNIYNRKSVMKVLQTYP